MTLEFLKNYEPEKYDISKQALKNPLDLAFLEILQTTSLIDKLERVDQHAYDDRMLAQIHRQLRRIIGYGHYNSIDTLKDAELILREEGSRTAAEEANIMADFSKSFDPAMLKAYQVIVKKANEHLMTKSMPPKDTEAYSLLDWARSHSAAAFTMLNNIIEAREQIWRWAK